MISAEEMKRVKRALPFWASLILLPITVLSALLGGFWLVLAPVTAWWLFGLLDQFTGLELDNANPETPDEDLFWYRLITIIWPVLQALLLFGLIIYASRAGHLSSGELALLSVGIGIVTGTVGINYAHELMHQSSKLERSLADLLLAMVLYSHFRSEHLLVHHRYVGTRRDPVTARYNEGFHRFFPRVLLASLRSSWSAERTMLQRKGLSWHHSSNPFWRYALLQLGFLALSFLLGGVTGLLMFVLQAFVAVLQLEAVNYVEHYGLTRKHLADGRYEPVRPHHSWNAAHKASNWLLINLQRHSDHHYKPKRRFPLLQNYDEAEAPQLPFGYPVMVALAYVPPLWRRVMNKRVRAWRKQYYPEITDWSAYNKGTLPLPR